MTEPDDEIQQELKAAEIERRDKEFQEIRESLEEIGQSMEAQEAIDIKTKERRSSMTEEFGEETRAERERREIFQEPYFATPAEIEAMSVEEHQRWIELGANVALTPEENTRIEVEAEAETEREAEMEKLESMSMAQYAAYMGEIPDEKLERIKAGEVEAERKRVRDKVVAKVKEEDMAAYAQMVEERDKNG